MKSFLFFLCFTTLSFVAQGQAVAWELSAEPGNQASNVATFQSVNFSNCILSRGSGVSATSGAGSMNSSAWFSGASPTTLDDAIAGNDYYEFTINSINCLFFNPTTFHIVLRSSATGPNTATLRCSSDGFTANIGTVTVTTTSTEFTFSETVSPNSQTITYRLYGYGTAAGGGTPSSGGTMRIGTSVVATDNDLEVFATTTFVTVTQVNNITVTDGDFVPATVFTSNVPGATFAWSRTPEAIGLAQTNGTGNVPAFTASNNTGSSITSTFTVNATAGNCTGPDMLFSITVDPAECTITVTFFGSPSPCNDNGTPNDPSDDFFTHNIGASFFNRPSTGSLQIVPGGDQIGTYSIPVTQIVGNQHIFNAVQLKADGTPTNVQMNFTDEPTCIDAAIGPTVQPCSSPPPACTITVTFFGSPSACNDNGTPNDPGDDFFTHNIGASFFNRPNTGNLQIVPGGDQIGTYSIPVTQIVGNQHIFNAVQLKADGTPTNVQMNFTDDPACIDAAIGPTVQPCSSLQPCEIIGMTFNNIGSCNNNNTPGDPNDDYFLCDLQVLFSNPPTTGNLVINSNPGVEIPLSVPVNQIGSSSHTFIGAHMTANGNANLLTAFFTANQACSGSSTGPAVNSCSSAPPSCAITDLEMVNPEPCNNNGTPENSTDDFYIADILVSFENPPATGLLTVSGSDLVDGDFSFTIDNVLSIGSPFAISNKKFKADGQPTSFLVQFTDAPGCVASLSTPTGTGPCSFLPPVLTCPASLTVSCMNEVPVANPASVSVVHDCPGNVTVIHVSDVTSNVTCINKLTITRTYQATDACGQSTTCSQIITVKDLTPPIVTCPASITVSCASLVPVVDVSALGVIDNCAGTAGISRSFLGEVISNQICANRYTLTRTYQGGDACGNTASCTQVITILDNIPPQITCPAPLTIQCASQVPPVNIAGVATNDNCTGPAPVVTFVSDVTINQSCVNRFTVNRTYRSTDACGNSSTCVQTITVFDNTIPTLTCPPPLTVQCANQVPAVNTGSVSTADNCGGTVTVTLAADVTVNQTCINRYTLNRIYRATDACGNSATCTQVITVFDNTSPVITFSDPLIMGVANGGRVDVQCFGQDPNWDLPELNENSVTVTDNCSGTVTVAFTQILEDEGNCPVDGYINLYRLTWTATDACGNSSSKHVFLALVDHISPDIEGIPDDITVNCDEVPDPPLNVYAIDECIDATIISYAETALAPGCQNGQVITRSWTAQDDCGNVTVEVQQITLVDHTGPELEIQQPELAGASDGSVFNYTCNDGGIPIFYDFLNAESMYSPPSCGSEAVISFDRNIIETSNCKFFGYIEQRTFHWKGVDNCGNETHMTLTARLIDDEPPVIVGVPDMTCVDDPALEDIEAIDNCEHPFLEYWDVKIPNPCGAGTALLRTYEAYDECFNMTRDSVILIPNNHTPPVITFVNPLLRELEPGEVITIDCDNHHGQQSPFGVQDVSVEGTCTNDISVNFIEEVIETSDCSTNGVLAILKLKWTAIDICGNQSSITVIAHVVDITSPVLVNFKPEVTIGCQDDLPGIQATDNCGDVSITIEERIVPGPCENEYDIERQIVATDPCGNTASESQIIHVGDGSGPIISGVIAEVCNDLSIPKVYAFDPCAGEYVEVSLTEKELETPCRDGKVIKRTWSAVDACGHETEIYQHIIVNDHTPPEIQIPTYSIILKFLDAPGRNLVNLSEADIIDQLRALDDGSIFVQDDCDEQIIPEFTLEITYANDCEAEGFFEQRIYTWIATDVCGNSSSISFSVNIADDLSPVFRNVPEDETIICGPLPQITPVYADDPAQPVIIEYSESMVPGNGAGVFVVSRTWVATDACGNASSTTQHITWIPDTFLECDILLPPSIICNSHGVIISSAVTGGLGGYTYGWEVNGGGFIQGGQGTDQILIYVGWSEVEVILNITDAYGCSTLCSANIVCFDSALDFYSDLPDNINPDAEQIAPEVEVVSDFRSARGADSKRLNIWPNPANESLYLSFETDIHGSIEWSLTNLLGQVLLTEVIDHQKGRNTNEIDVSQIPEGSYLMQIKSGREIMTQVIVIVHSD